MKDQNPERQHAPDCEKNDTKNRNPQREHAPVPGRSRDGSVSPTADFDFCLFFETSQKMGGHRCKALSRKAIIGRVY